MILCRMPKTKKSCFELALGGFIETIGDFMLHVEQYRAGAAKYVIVCKSGFVGAKCCVCILDSVQNRAGKTHST